MPTSRRRRSDPTTAGIRRSTTCSTRRRIARWTAMSDLPFEMPFDPEKLSGLRDRNFKAPDLSGTVEGWRAWGVPANTPRWARPMLYSVTYTDYFWEPRKISEAYCAGCRGTV